MTPNLLPSMWLVWLLYLALEAACVAALLYAGPSPTGVLIALAMGLTAPGVTLALRPARALRLLHHRRRRTCDLRQPAELHTWPGQFETFRLGPKLSLRPHKGEVLFDPPIALRDVQQVTLEQQGQHWYLSLSSQGDDGDTPSHNFQMEDIHPACAPLLYWALWRLCQHNGWALRAPFGSQSAASIQGDARSRLAQQHGWASQDMQGLRGDIPFLEEDSPALARYRFPEHDTYEPRWGAQPFEATAQRRHLALLASYSLFGLVTAPLAVPFLWLRARLARPRDVELVIKDGQLHIGGSAEPLEDILYLSLLPVHPGPPVLLTRNRAVLLGGLTDYQERVLCGRHLLGRLLRELPQESPQPPPTPAQPLTRPRGPAAAEAPRASLALPALGRLGGALWVGALAVGMLGLSLYSWHPTASAARLFGHWSLVTLLEQASFWGSLALGWFITWRLWSLWGPGDSRPWLLKGVAMSLGVVAAVGSVAVNALPYSREALFTLNLTNTQAPGARLTRRDLQGINLNFSNLPGADLQGTDLARADMNRVNLQSTDMRGVNLTRAHLFETNLRRADLRGADLTRASLREANLREANLREANLTRASMRGANLREANLREANLTRADLERADLSGADLRGANLERANLEYANLSGADLRGATLGYANLARIKLKGARPSAAETSPPRTQGVSLDRHTTCQDGQPLGQRDTETCLGLAGNLELIKCLDGAPLGKRTLRECLQKPDRTRDKE